MHPSSSHQNKPTGRQWFVEVRLYSMKVAGLYSEAMPKWNSNIIYTAIELFLSLPLI